MTTVQPIYNSRIIQGLLEYIRASEPGVDINALLQRADLSRGEVENPAHWFTQDEIDRFHQATLAMVSNPTLPRDAGRALPFSKGAQGWMLALLRLSTPAAAYSLMGRIYPSVSRGATVSVRRLGPNRVEIVSVPTPEAEEKSYQCQHRRGTFETLAQLFTNEMADVEHPECLFEGGSRCRYVVSWTPPPSMTLRRARNVVGALAAVAVVASVLLLESSLAVVVLAVAFVVVGSLALHAAHVEKREISNLLRRATGGTGSDLIDEIRRRQGHALLVQSVGRLTASGDHAAFAGAVLENIEAHLEMDRSFLFLGDPGAGNLELAAKRGDDGIVVGDDLAELLQRAHEGEEEATRGLADRLGTRATAVVPLASGGDTLGFLLVAASGSDRAVERMDIEVLEQVAAQTAMEFLYQRTFAQLDASERKYRELVESASAIILRTDDAGRVVFANGSARKHFEDLQETIDGTLLSHLVYGPSAAAGGRLRELLGSSVRRGDEVVEEIVERSAHHVRRFTAWTFKVATNPQGEPQGILAIGTDVTATREEEERRQKLEAFAVDKQRLESISTLSGGIAHGFNNVLQRVYGYAGLLRVADELSDDSRSYVERILEGTRDARRLTELILGFGRGGREDSDPIDPRELVSDTLQVLAPAAGSVEIVEHHEDEPGTICADPRQLEQVLASVVTNALDAMPNGGELRVETSYHQLDALDAERDLDKGYYLRIRVADNGIGMSEDVKRRIFDPFFSTRPMGPATQGMGLAAAHGIVKNHGGQILVESEPGTGTTVDIYLPATAGSVAAEPVAGNVRLEGDETILVADDEKLVTATLAALLARYGYSVLTAASGTQALAQLTRTDVEIDLLILDAVMPVMDGIKTIKKADEAGIRVPVLLSSGYPLGDEGQELIESGRVRFVKKPYSAQELLLQIRAALSAAQSGQAATVSSPTR